MPVDVKQNVAVLALNDHVLIPNLVEECFARWLSDYSIAIWQLGAA